MKRFSIFILLFLSHSVFALTGKGFELLSETIESSPNANGYFKAIDSGTGPKSYAYAFAKANNSQGKAGQNTMVSGYHSVAISNATEKDQIYVYKYEVNCDGQYFRKVDRVMVHPNGFAKDDGYSYLNTYHARPGIYRVNVVTQIEGESNHVNVDMGSLKIVR